ncbi:RRXRR domain-containing protein [Acididesulfobacillus acetoxydans]
MVFVLDMHKKPLMPCSEKRARQMLQKDKALVHKLVLCDSL